ncbi:MAG: NADP-dependent malic enzyme [Desertimonas sp.]
MTPEQDPAFAFHRGGKVGISPRVSVRTPADLALAYTPGVGRVSQAIADDPSEARHYTGRANTIAVLTNGTAVLGLGDIGPEAAMPVMEGKAILFHRFAGIDAYPICLDARTPDEVVAVAKALAPTFGGINLEDIAAPDCFEIEQRLQDELDIPVFHDDQHGTAIVVGAAVMNAARLTERLLSELRVVVVGVGAAGTACGRLLHDLGVADVVAVDRAGILHRDLVGLAEHHRWFAEHGNREQRRGGVREALRGADVLIGVSGPGTVEPAWLAEMNPDAAVFAMANPVPEVLPSQVPDNVAVVGTGRSDFPNQINNVLAFPGVFRGLLDAGAARVTPAMKRAAAAALADLVDEPTPERIVPGVFDPGVADAVAEAIREVSCPPLSAISSVPGVLAGAVA